MSLPWIELQTLGERLLLHIGRYVWRSQRSNSEQFKKKHIVKVKQKGAQMQDTQTDGVDVLQPYRTQRGRIISRDFRKRCQLCCPTLTAMCEADTVFRVALRIILYTQIVVFKRFYQFLVCRLFIWLLESIDAKVTMSSNVVNWWCDQLKHIFNCQIVCKLLRKQDIDQISGNRDNMEGLRSHLCCSKSVLVYRNVASPQRWTKESAG